LLSFHVSDTNADFWTFWDETRYEIARSGVYNAISESGGTAAEETGGWAPRWGVVRLRQSGPAWPTACDKPVDVTANAAFAGVSDSAACAEAGAGRLGVWAPTVTAASYSNTASAPTGTFVADPTVAAQVKASYATAVFATGVNSNSYLIPAGRDGIDGDGQYADRPLRLALVDALTKAKADNDARFKEADRLVKQMLANDKANAQGRPVEKAFAGVLNPRQSPTRYGKTSAREHFAECFTLFKNDPTAMRRVSATTFDWFTAGTHVTLSATPLEP